MKSRWVILGGADCSLGTLGSVLFELEIKGLIGLVGAEGDCINIELSDGFKEEFKVLIPEAMNGENKLLKSCWLVMSWVES